MTSQIRRDLQSKLIPMVIGITGHRDLRSEDLSTLEDKVRSIFRELINLYPCTPLQLLSGLAEGADRLVARVALDEGIEIIAPLPMPTDQYIEDFKTTESRAEFKDLLSKAVQSFPVPTQNKDKQYDETDQSRRQSYVDLGVFIVRNSHILIALWDGLPSVSIGGTASIVGFKLNGVPENVLPRDNPLDSVDKGPVYHIVTPRVSHPKPIAEAYCFRKLLPKDLENEAKDVPNDASLIRIILTSINSYNEDFIRNEPLLKEKIEKSKQYEIPSYQKLGLKPGLLSLLDRYAIADALAIKYQQKQKVTTVRLFRLVILAFLFFELFAHVFSEEPWVLAMYPAVLGFAYFYYYLTQKKRYQNKHLDYRALAEGLRIQLFWNIGRINTNVSDHYLLKQRDELEWIRDAVKVTNILPSLEILVATEEVVNNYAIVQKQWVNNQKEFFNKATQRDKVKLENYEKLIKSLFFAGLLLSIAVASWMLSGQKVMHWLIVVMGLLPALAAAFETYSEKMAFSVQAKQYVRMQRIFCRADEQLNNQLEKKDYISSKKLLLFLGKEALEENGDWVNAHRERPIKVPIAG